MKNRFVILGEFFLVTAIIQYYFWGTFLPSNENKDLWFYSGIFMLIFSILFIEPYYTSPKNVVTNAIPLLLVLLAIKESFANTGFWWTGIVALITLIIASIGALSLDDASVSPDNWKNRVSTTLKSGVVLLGQGKILYSAVFLYFLFTYYSIQDFYTLLLFILWFGVVSINPKNIHNFLTPPNAKYNKNQIGEIFSVQSKKVFLVKIFEDKQGIHKFDLVKFKYSMQDKTDLVIIGIVFDTYLLNQEKWGKILQLSEPQKDKGSLEKNSVYKISDLEEIESINSQFKINDIVGIVVEGSSIGKIKFEYSKKDDDLQEGDLLELRIGNRRLFYQVINGITEKEKLENKNETGFIQGEAIQFGEWQSEKLSFQKFGWVPVINTPVFKANTSDVLIEEFTHPLYKLGDIPGTSLPSVINLQDAVSHHMALLGVTGAGKSFLAREIINEIKNDTKVICVDFNKEFFSTLLPTPSNIIGDYQAQAISERIDWVSDELDKFANRQSKAQILTKRNEIKSILKAEIENFLNDTTRNTAVFELPDVSNTTGILDYTKYFFRVLFEIAKEKQISGTPVKLCVVLEEAHTVIPEWNFSGSNDKSSQALVNSIGQITLQGRKYGVGFLVIAQRTANVSKTVLTQCNTVVCFQAFDETSFNFLSSYVGKDMVQSLPHLKKYHAIIAGKAIKSNMPMIVDLTRKNNQSPDSQGLVQ
ncbi:MAG: DUF87 domain-containing protein [Bacteroidia bacterium]|nr:DUF87 domain-containing protein [Bacteroidia bacterium]